MQISELDAHLRAGYRMVDHDDDSWSIDFSELDQSVTIRVVTVAELPWLLVFAEVCSVVRYDSKTVVGHSATLAVGGLCAYDGRYFLQHAVPLSASTTDVDAVVYLVAHEAARLRTSAPTPAAPRESLFAHYAE